MMMLLAALVAVFIDTVPADLATGDPTVAEVDAGAVAAEDTDAPDVSSPATATPPTSNPGNRYRTRSFFCMSSQSRELNRSSRGTGN